jgi:hypothetical protein
LNVYRSSLFLYAVTNPEDKSPIIHYLRATVFRWGKQVDFNSLKDALQEYEQNELDEFAEKAVSYEKASQVDSSLCVGLGVDWVRIDSQWKYPHGIVTKEKQIKGSQTPFNYEYFRREGIRLGYSSFLREAARFGQAKRRAPIDKRFLVTFWQWITRKVRGD